MFSRITSFILVIGLVISGFWGYREHREKQALLLKAENQYQRAFHDLSDRMNALQDSLGKSLVVNSQKQLSGNLTESWRLAAEAHSDVGELPLSLMPFNNTMNFLNDLGNFTYRTSIRHPDQVKTLSEADYKSLTELYHRSKTMEAQLADLQTAVLSKNLRWMDAELALSQTTKKTDNQIVDGFRALEKSVSGMKPLTFSGPTETDLQTRHNANVNKLDGSNVNEKQATAIIQKWLGMSNTNGIQVMRNGQGNKFPSYSVAVTKPDGSKVFFTMAIKGGHVTWYMNNRAVQGEKFDLDQGAQKAIAFLKAHDINATEVVKIDSFDSVGVYDIVPMQNGVRIYPDKVVVKVALDNGEIIGLNSQDYAFNHGTRAITTPKLSEAKARTFVNSHVKVREVNRAIVLNDMNKEKQVYEFLGTLENETYKVYINADTGEEVGVEKLNS
ncbi:MAG: germination protein YpeB [Tumebacillaceae bacterium]